MGFCDGSIDFLKDSVTCMYRGMLLGSTSRICAAEIRCFGGSGAMERRYATVSRMYLGQLSGSTSLIWLERTGAAAGTTEVREMNEAVGRIKRGTSSDLRGSTTEGQYFF